jgi:hypothetical protein
VVLVVVLVAAMVVLVSAMVSNATTVSTVLLAAAVSTAGVHHSAPRHDARTARLLLALGLLQRVELADLLLLEALQLPALLLEGGNALVSLAVGGVASRDGALLLLAGLGEKGTEGLNLELELLTGLLVGFDGLDGLFVLDLELVELAAGGVVGVDLLAVLAESQGELLLEDGNLLLERSVAVASFVTRALSLSDGLGELNGLGTELGGGVLSPEGLVLQVGDSALDVKDLAALGLDIVFQVISLNVHQAESILPVTKSCLKSLDVDGEVGDLLVCGCNLSLRLLKTEVEVGDVRLSVAKTGGLVLELVAETLDDGNVLVALGLGSAKSGAEVVDVPKDGLVLHGQSLQLSGDLANPGVGTLELILQTVLLVEELRSLVLQGTYTLGEVDNLLAGGFELCLEIGVLVPRVGQLSCQVAVVTALSLALVDCAVTLSLTVT